MLSKYKSELNIIDEHLLVSLNAVTKKIFSFYILHFECEFSFYVTAHRNTGPYM